MFSSFVGVDLPRFSSVFIANCCNNNVFNTRGKVQYLAKGREGFDHDEIGKWDLETNSCGK